jgi:hypothetical protein
MTDHGGKNFGIDFIDPLFAVAIHIGFTHGVLEEPWFTEWRWPKGHETFDALVLLLAFWTIVLSWVGYHKSISLKPLRAEDRMGFVRFILDIVLVTLYALLLVKFRDIDATLQLNVGIYFLFLVWDLCKVKEHKLMYAPADPFGKRYRRELVTTGWFVVFLGLLLLRTHCGLTDNATLGALWVATFMYRINKEFPILGLLGTVVTRLGPRGV